MLDTVNPNGYSDGSIDQAQFDWLETVLSQSAGKAVMVFSHHTSRTMKNTLICTGGDLESRVNGAGARAAAQPPPGDRLGQRPHPPQPVTAHPRPGGGGLWEINTASHIDWPQQSRLIELTDNHDGTLSIFTTMVDHAGPVSYAGDRARPPAGLGRELAANDPQNRTDSGGVRSATATSSCWSPSRADSATQSGTGRTVPARAGEARTAQDRARGLHAPLDQGHRDVVVDGVLETGLQ